LQQYFFLTTGFYAFCENFDVKAVCERNDTLNKCTIRTVIDNFVHEQAIDFDLGKNVAELLDIAKRGVAGTEVIDTETEPQFQHFFNAL